MLVEQYIDFVVNRLFRESLFVHCRTRIADQLRTRTAAVTNLCTSLLGCHPPMRTTRLDHSRQEYLESDGATLFTNDPGIKAALDALSARWPWTQSRTSWSTRSARDSLRRV